MTIDKNTIIAVDFDGTIVTHEYPAVGKPVPYCIETLQKINKSGAKIILYTMRSGEELAQAVEYLINNDIKLWAVNENPEQKRWTASPKVYAHIYIDDAAIGGFTLQDTNYSPRPYIDWCMVDNILFPEEF